ncbi:MAG: [citrate (pro-3S)-lyase] ligase [Deltaproteobacteria bacterium]|nr:[citrate (pro-3S)-lyase] ligase [Deltaproteobacteria bacterium]
MNRIVRELYDPAATDELHARVGLKFPDGSDSTVGIFEGDELIACGSIKGDVLVGFAVSPKSQGEGLLARLCTELINRGVESGLFTFYVFTKPETAAHFEESGFKAIVSAPPHVTMLEWGENSVEKFLKSLRNLAKDGPGQAAAIVMNANPFTLGHRHLALTAARESEKLYVMVVEEDKSFFPFADRLKMVRAGLADLKNVTVIPSGKYVISDLTFPTYFLKESDVSQARCDLDLRLFGELIAPALKVNVRYVGSEPYCRITNQYNSAMAKILPEYAVTVKEIKRIENGLEPIGASRVRELLKAGLLEKTKSLVPRSTYDFLEKWSGREVN